MELGHKNFAVILGMEGTAYSYLSTISTGGGGHNYSVLPFSLALEHSDICLQFWICGNYLLFAIAVLVITSFLVDNIYALLVIRVWLNLSFVFFVSFMSDPATAIPYRQSKYFLPYSVQMQRNTDQKNSEYSYFSRSECFVFRLIRSNSLQRAIHIFDCVKCRPIISIPIIRMS